MRKLYTVIFTFVFLAIFAQKPLERLEPMNWWVGMKHNTITLLVYGKDISKLQPELKYEGVQILKSEKVENPNYLFVTINIADGTKPGTAKINFKTGNKTFVSKDFPLLERKANSANRDSYTSKDVFYLIMSDRFANGNEKNDSQPNLIDKVNRKDENGRHGGDLRGVINHLDYIKNLGATTVWMTPVCEDNEAKYSYHGYAQTDLYNIDGRYGSNEEYKELSAELKKRNMKLVMDYVTNHWGVSHWLIKDLPFKEWVHWYKDGQNGFKRSNYRTTTQVDPYASEKEKDLALNGWFDTTMPDINQSNPLVLQYLIQNAIWWIEYADLDGYRVDTYPYNDKEGMAKWAKAITDEYPRFNIVGETWMYTPANISFWQRNSKIAEIEGYNSYLPSVMDFELYNAIPNAFKEEENWDKGMVRLYNSFANDYLYPDTQNIMNFFENHDTERFNEIFNGNPEYYKMALTLISTVRGIPQIYYGSEIGMKGSKMRRGDGDIRRDFPGGWKGDTQNAFNISEQTKEQKEFFDFTQKILNWRKNKDVIHTGKTRHFVPQNGVYVYFRYNKKEKVMVVINKNDKPQTLDLGYYSEIIPAKINVKEVIADKEFTADKTLEIPGKTSYILEIKE